MMGTPKSTGTNGGSKMAIKILYGPLHRKWLFGETSMAFLVVWFSWYVNHTRINVRTYVNICNV